MQVSLNGVALVPTSNTSALWHSDQPDRFEGAYLAWDVPATALKTGNNTLTFECTATVGGRVSESGVGGGSCSLDHWELLLPANSRP
jgi:hypothetical protein